jgi:hypothetical protein
MKTLMVSFLGLLLVLPLAAQTKRPERRSLLDSDPEVVYLDRALTSPIKLSVIKEAPVYADKEGNRRLGFLKSDQVVQLEAITERAYRVRGQGLHNGIAGWVPPWAFSSKDPDFVENLKKLYQRQLAVQALIESKTVALGMDLTEVEQAKGKPSKTNVRRTATGQSGSWEFVEFEEVKHYITRVDPSTGIAYRQLSHVTREEKSKVVVEFENDVVTAVEESEDNQGGNVRVIVPPLIFRW